MMSFVSNVSYPERLSQQQLKRVIAKRVGILGMARSGLAVARLLRSYGAKVFISDQKPESELKDKITVLKELGIEWETGGHSSKVWSDKDFLVISPGISPDIGAIKTAESMKLPVYSEIEIAGWLCPARIIGITGTNGKTTTTMLLGEILKKAGLEVQVAGNMGVAFADLADSLSDKGNAVLELSSFQLERIADFKPHIAVLLNISPDHQDRYNDFESYLKAKLRIFENQSPEDYAILNADDLSTPRIKKNVSSKSILFGTKSKLARGVYLKENYLVSTVNGKEAQIIPAPKIGIKGLHNLYNAAAATAVSQLVGVGDSHIASTLEQFKGVEHRLEEIATINGIKFINDSKATNVNSVLNALQTVPAPVILIAGGKGKGESFLPLSKLIKEKVKFLILIGQAGELMKSELGSFTKTVTASTLSEAVKMAFNKAQAQDTILLSPACASFDMFKDFEDRGKEFKKAVAELQKKHGN
ncbi:MAG: UDP-N-acetylmuramoyl-L-alanine--D-glutamate ligase [candidate division Zixibacteria bacterium]|nr:UDP-N-acetylmuramoyl-L-alanine--D-glutamate ligase [candidate division Zixibacteria bacterium]